ncbi:MAG: hydrogenase maturation protease [Woeseiaceae bacterium]|nr:hydrogenase maturation protease [Woeseiaceae bacterium]
MTSTLVLGVGNVLLTDEGAGIHAMRYLKKHYDLHDIKYLDAGTLSFTLASNIAAADHLIVFDAAQIGAAAGDIKVFEDEQVDEFLRSGKCSVHEVGFADLMDIARLEGYLPQRYALIGIQPEVLGWGEAPSESVRRALPRAAANAAALVHKWRRTTYPKAVNL